MSQLFDGAMVFEGAFIALDRLSAVFNLADEDMLDRMTAGAEVIAEEPPDASGLRLWWERVGPSGDRSWISLDPGEFRTTPPELPCVIRTMPEGAPAIPWRTRLQAVVDRCVVEKMFGPFEADALRQATALLHRPAKPVLPRALYDHLRRAHAAATPNDYRTLIQDAYHTWFKERGCPVAEFTMAVVFTQVQASLNAFVAEEWHEDPWSYFKGYVSLMMEKPSERDAVVAKLGRIAEEEFADGRRSVDRALAGSFQSMARSLSLAWHRFFAVHMIGTALQEVGVPVAALAVDPMMSDEALACTMTGLEHGARFCLRNPRDMPLYFLQGDKQSFASVRARARRFASPILPSFPVVFADILAAEALTLSDRQTSVGEGIMELRRLRGEVAGIDTGFESCWADQALLAGYKRLGDTENATKLARSIMGRFMVRQTLGETGRTDPIQP